MSAIPLEIELRAIGIDCVVEERGRLAILLVKHPVPSAQRRTVVSLARKHGFSNVAMELRPAVAGR